MVKENNAVGIVLFPQRVDNYPELAYKNTKRACPMGKPFIIYNKVVIVLVANYN